MIFKGVEYVDFLEELLVWYLLVWA
jgi:hypothetical protein